MLSLVNEGFITKDMVINPIEIIADATQVDWRPGVVRQNVYYGQRKIVVEILFIASDQLDFALKRDKLFSIFSDIKPFYLYEGRPTDRTSTYEFEMPGQSFGPNNQLPKNIERIKGKRYKVIRTSMSEVEQSGLLGSCTVEFYTFQLPFAESSARSLELHDFRLDRWQTGQGLDIAPEASRQYVFRDAGTFIIHNAGNIEVRNDIRDNYMKIIIEGATTNLKITNLTNGTFVQFILSTNISDKLEITSPYSFKRNDLNVFKDTNRGLFVLNPGENVISVEGAITYKITFDFRFYYK